MVDDPRVDIHYLKSESFREVACDGVLGGPTPGGKIWIAFYTERFPLPRTTRHPVRTEADGSHSLEMPGEVIEGREGIIRNVEFGVYVSKEEAKTLAKWLTEALRDAEWEEKTNE